MTETQFLTLLQQTLWMVLLLSSPMLITSMVVGIGISIFQAVTQIQESTLTFVPKILISLGVFVLVGPWMVNTMINHTAQILNSLIDYAH
jgi:flagellar biosynthesis protein FliQ